VIRPEFVRTWEHCKRCILETADNHVGLCPGLNTNTAFYSFIRMAYWEPNPPPGTQSWGHINIEGLRYTIVDIDAFVTCGVANGGFSEEEGQWLLANFTMELAESV